LRDGKVDPRKVVLLEDAPGISSSEGDAQPVEIVSFTPHRVEFVVDVDKPGIVVLLENYWKEWEARVDGELVPILRTDYTFMGVAVDKGKHTIEFRYNPVLFKKGFWVSLIAWLCGFGFLVFARRLKLLLEG